MYFENYGILFIENIQGKMSEYKEQIVFLGQKLKHFSFLAFFKLDNLSLGESF